MPFLGRLDRYVARICAGSFLVCFCFIVGLFVLADVLQSADKFSPSIAQLPDEQRRYGFLLVVAYYAAYLPFIYLMVAPFVTVTAGMFATSRLMGANEFVPMLFTGRRISRILVPVLVMGAINVVAMVALREFALPKLVQTKDRLESMVKRGVHEQALRSRIIRLPQGNRLIVDRYFLQSDRIEGLNLRLRRPDGGSEDSIRAKSALFVVESEVGPGWRLTEGVKLLGDTSEGQAIRFLPLAQVEGFAPQYLRNKIREGKALHDLSYSEILGLVREDPSIHEYTVALHRHITFPFANLLLLLLALPFALRFERGSKIERVFFALVICAAYFIADLIFQSVGAQGSLHPVFAAWLPTLIFGSLGIVIFDSVRS